MPALATRALALACSLFLAGCASRSLPAYQRPLARSQIQTVRTTAYTHTESDHRAYSDHNALGGRLSSGSVRSAAADWSRWPAGTVFRIQETGEVYRVDDYGWALSGTNTIDLYKPSRSAMNAWGTRRVTIENLQWGSVDESLAILRRRSRYAHVRRMVEQIESRYAELKRPVPGSTSYAIEEELPAPIAAAPAFTTAEPVRAIPVRRTTDVVLTPFSASLPR